eukprot:Pgem_evm1s18192
MVNSSLSTVLSSTQLTALKNVDNGSVWSIISEELSKYENLEAKRTSDKINY